MERLTESVEKEEIEESVGLLEQLDMKRLTPDQLDVLSGVISAIPEEKLEASAELCYRMAFLKLVWGDSHGVRKWQNALLAHRDHLAENTEQRRMLENRIFCLGIAAHQGQNSNFLMNLAILSHEYGDAVFPLAKLSATRGAPSVLRGAKDLSVLGKHFRASASIVKPLLGVLLESPKGVCEAAIAEILYEQNDLNGAMAEAANAINAEDEEIVFAGLATLARIGAADATVRSPEEILDHIGALISSKKLTWLLPGFEAFRTRFAILRGDVGAIREWLEHCGINDLDICIPMNYYRILTKAKAYLALGEHRAAATLLENLHTAMEEDFRPLDTAECLMDCAIAYEALGSTGHALKKLEKALLTVQEFGYVRVFADEGGAAYNLMLKYTAPGNPVNESIHRAYLDKIMAAAEAFSRCWPQLYGTAAVSFPTQAEEQPDSDVELTQSELQVLKLLGDGYTNNKIAKEIHIELSTVKFHVSNIYRKLGAKGRVEALNLARKAGLLP